MKRGWSVDASRKTTILAFGVLALPIFFASRTTSLWTAVALISLGTAAHQAVSSNIYTIISDVFPRRIVGSVTGLAGFSGAIAAALVSELVGFILTATGSYTVIFGLFSVAYVLGWMILRIGIPTIRPIQL
jgi:ACS family hexuronate transporter-like MFS transporter